VLLYNVLLLLMLMLMLMLQVSQLCWRLQPLAAA
jgi:hypothetical protein